MIRTAFTTLALLLVLSSQAQIIVNQHGDKNTLVKIDTVNTDYQHTDYIFVLMHDRMFSLKITCSVDYGQERHPLQRKSKIRHSNGDKMLFNSEADAVQYITNNGWIYQGFEDYVYVFTRPK